MMGITKTRDQGRYQYQMLRPNFLPFLPLTVPSGGTKECAKEGEYERVVFQFRWYWGSWVLPRENVQL